MREGEGEKGKDGSQHWGPMQGFRRWRAGRRGGGVTGCYRGHRLGMAGKGAFPPSVDMQCLSSIIHQAGGSRPGFTGTVIFRIFVFYLFNISFFYFCNFAPDTIVEIVLRQRRGRGGR